MHSIFSKRKTIPQLDSIQCLLRTGYFPPSLLSLSFWLASLSHGTWNVRGQVSPWNKFDPEYSPFIAAWNVGTCLYMAWTSISCLNQFINSVVWNGNAINWAPVWCDICMLHFGHWYCPFLLTSHVASRIIVGASVAIPAASLCINRRLYHIASVKTVTVTPAEACPIIRLGSHHINVFRRNDAQW